FINEASPRSCARSMAVNSSLVPTQTRQRFHFRSEIFQLSAPIPISTNFSSSTAKKRWRTAEKIEVHLEQVLRTPSRCFCRMATHRLAKLPTGLARDGERSLGAWHRRV